MTYLFINITVTANKNVLDFPNKNISVKVKNYQIYFKF